MKLTLEMFQEEIKKHKSICVTYFHQTYHDISIDRYDLDSKGNVFQVYNYSHTAYFLCKESDDKIFAFWIGVGTEIISIEPTPIQMVKEFALIE